MEHKWDVIFIERVPLFANHGVFEQERCMGQKFILSLKLFLPLQKAGKTDELCETIHYGEIVSHAISFLQNHTFSLLEAAAQNVATELLNAYGLLRAIEVTIEKPGAPVPFSFERLGVTIFRKKHEAYLSIGSNIGDTKAHLDFAVKKLSTHPEIKLDVVSDYIITKPYGYTDQADFLNAALKLETTMEAYELLDVMQAIEREDGRERLIHWGPRTLDLDLLLFDDVILDTERLTVPHPEMEKRAFVLQPMAQIAPKKRHPVLHQTMEQLWKQVASSDL